jgi:prepilin-type N-terminal cleavage/methylation domain-containing protein
MRQQKGMTIVEVLLALVIIGAAFAGMAYIQTTNLRMTTNARLTTDVKAAANQVLEQVMSDVLETTITGGNKYFAFNDYYWTCPTALTPPTGALPVVNRPSCTGTRTIGDVQVTYAVAGESGVTGEGVLTVTVTAVHGAGGQRITLGDRVTCYDIYPSPTSLAPEPCPAPKAGGGGRW